MMSSPVLMSLTSMLNSLNGVQALMTSTFRKINRLERPPNPAPAAITLRRCPATPLNLGAERRKPADVRRQPPGGRLNGIFAGGASEPATRRRGATRGVHGRREGRQRRHRRRARRGHAYRSASASAANTAAAVPSASAHAGLCSATNPAVAAPAAAPVAGIHRRVLCRRPGSPVVSMTRSFRCWPPRCGGDSTS